MSARDIAAVIELLIAENAPEAIVEATPIMPPTFAENPPEKLLAALEPDLVAVEETELKALFSSWFIVPIKLSNFGVRSTEPFATSAISSPPLFLCS